MGEDGNGKAELTTAQLEQRAQAAATHGARSEAQVRPRARTVKQRLMRQIGLKIADLDPIARGYLDNWARAQAKIELMDDWTERHGFLDEEGKPPGFVVVYVSMLNSARLSLAKLADHLKAQGAVEPSMVAVLQGTARRLT